MRIAVAASVVLLGSATAQPAPPAPGWTDVPAMIAATIAPIDDPLRACLGDHLPSNIGLNVSRDRDGNTRVTHPLYGLGQRGPTAEERCLVAAVARLSLPPLPPGVDLVGFGYMVRASGSALPAVDPEFAAWRDLPAMVAAITSDHGAELATCSRQARTVHVVLDRRRAKTRAWLPAWQFHSSSHDGTTPAAHRGSKRCLARQVRAWTLPPLPAAMAVLELTLAIAP
jgi:hypothetical protein